MERGHCTWLDRGLRPYEPNQIRSRYRTVEEAVRVAEAINSGATWTFWVFNEDNRYFRSTTPRPAPPRRSQPIDR